MDIAESAFQSRRNSSSACRSQQQSTICPNDYERRHWNMMCSNSTTTDSFYSASRHRNLSGPCTTGSTSRPILDNRALATPPPGVPGAREHNSRDKENHQPRGEGGRSSSNRKLDRSLSDSQDRINSNGRSVNASRYKTELCRPFEENGHCKYGDKCQFAHGAHELRNLTRHPKYKTERCRTYHTVGLCPYGPRCHFIHNEDDLVVPHRKNSSNSAGGRQSTQKYILAPAKSYSQRPSNLCGLNSLGSSFESVSTTSSPGNLSPSHLDDQFPSVGTFSSSAVCDSTYPETTTGDCDSIRTSPVFNFPASDASSIMTPLNVQTQHMYNNMLDMAALAHRFSNVMNMSRNQHNNQNAFSTNLNVNQAKHQPEFEAELFGDKGWSVGNASADMGALLPPTSSSPVSDDSMGSNGSLELSSAASLDNLGLLVNSPHEMGLSMRLPIFNQLSS